MSLRDEENALFDIWKQHRIGFLRDGAGQCFELAPIKIVFILKEAVGEIDEPEASWDLRDFINVGARWMTWNNIARWTAYIIDNADWQTVARITQQGRSHIIQKVAGVNLKKIPGNAFSDMQQIRRFALEDQKFLNQQITLYDADLIVCCGTFWIAETVFGLKQESRIRCAGRWYHPRSQNLGTVLEFTHPQARGEARVRFDEFRACINDLRDQGQLAQMQP